MPARPSGERHHSRPARIEHVGPGDRRGDEVHRAQRIHASGSPLRVGQHAVAHLRRARCVAQDLQNFLGVQGGVLLEHQRDGARHVRGRHRRALEISAALGRVRVEAEAAVAAAVLPGLRLHRRDLAPRRADVWLGVTVPRRAEAGEAGEVAGPVEEQKALLGCTRRPSPPTWPCPAL